jgi:hypothetical protein
MDKHRDSTRVITGATGAILILILGIDAAYLLAGAKPEALAATSKALLTIGLIGLLMTAVVAMHLSLTSRDHRGGHGRGGDQRPGPGPAPPMDDVDAEFFRIINDERLRDIQATRPHPPTGLPVDGGHQGSPC